MPRAKPPGSGNRNPQTSADLFLIEEDLGREGLASQMDSTQSISLRQALYYHEMEVFRPHKVLGLQSNPVPAGCKKNGAQPTRPLPQLQ